MGVPSVTRKGDEVIVDVSRFVLSAGGLGVFDQQRFSGSINANSATTLSITVPGKRRMFLLKIRYAGFTADTIDVRFENFLNYRANDVRIDNAALDNPTIPFPFPIASPGSASQIILTNTDSSTRNYEVLLDFILINENLTDSFEKEFRNMVHLR